MERGITGKGTPEARAIFLFHALSSLFICKTDKDIEERYICRYMRKLLEKERQTITSPVR